MESIFTVDQFVGYNRLILDYINPRMGLWHLLRFQRSIVLFEEMAQPALNSRAVPKPSGNYPAVSSSTVASGALLFTDSIPLSRDAAFSYIWLLPTT